MEVFKLFGSIMIDNDKANQSLAKTDKQASKSGTNMSSIFKKVGIAVTAAFSVAKIKEFGAECMEAYKVQIEAETKLETIMKQRMKSSDASIQSVKDLTAAQQNLGVVGDEVQMAGAQQLATFLNTEGALKSLIPAMNDLAVQQNGVNVSSGNMVSIGNLMGKVMQGQTGALKKVGVTFTAAQEKVLKYGNEQQRAAMLAEVITSNVGHMNAEIAKTDDGKQQQFKNTLGDLQEVIGQKLIPLQTAYYGILATVGTFLVNNIIPYVDKAISLFGSFANSISSNSNVASTMITLWQTYGLPIFNSIVNMLYTLYDSCSNIFPYLQSAIVSLFNIATIAWTTIGLPIFNGIVFSIRQLEAVFSIIFPIISSIVADAFSLISIISNEVLIPIFSTIGAFLSGYFMPAFRAVFSFVSSFVASTFQRIDNLWKTVLKPIFEGVINFLGGVFQGDWEKILDGLLSITQGIWNGIKTAIMAPMESAKQFVKGIIDAIKGFFNFDIKWPKIPLPHFSVKPKDWGIGDLLKGKIPSLGIDWYAKAMDKGMILDSPTIFGAAGGKLLGAGEAGSETVVGTQSLMDMIKSAASSGNRDMFNVLCEIRDYLADEDRWYRVMLRALTDGSFAIVLDGREVGRIVRKYA